MARMAIGSKPIMSKAIISKAIISTALITMAAAGAMLAMPVEQPAYGQPVQYQFTPPPPIVALPGTEAGAPPTAWAGPRAYSGEPAPQGKPHLYHTHHGRPVLVPQSVMPGMHSYSDRLARCAQAGAAAGLHAGGLGAFTSRCAD